MNKLLTIIKKELKRVFTDKRMLASLFLPGILIYVIYTIMGGALGTAFGVEEDHVYKVAVFNMDEKENIYSSLEIEGQKYEVELIDNELDVNEAKEALSNKDIELFVNYDYDDMSVLENVDIYYNSSSTASSTIFAVVYSYIYSDSASVIFKYPVNGNVNETYDLATKEDTSMMLITMLFPYLILIFLFTGCQSIAIESIAGEKERGTIYTLLVTPTPRKQLAFGKIIALSITSLLSAISSFLGIMLSMPNLTSQVGSITLSMYGVSTYISILAIMVVTVLIFVTVLSILSCFAKTIKEASQWSSIIMVVVTLVGISSMVGVEGMSSNRLAYLIPVYNSVQCLSGILSLKLDTINFFIALLSNIVYIVIGIYVLAKMFDSEKIMSK